jgi:hypothetical protein
MLRVAHRTHANRDVVRALVTAGLLLSALALGACSKCDVPILLPTQAAVQSCHDGPRPQ